MAMRLKSEIWIKALLHRAASAGSPGVVVRRGDKDAGAVLVVVARLDGTADLYGPAPAGIESPDGERLLQCWKSRAPEAEITAVIERESRFDSDIWVAEIEDREGRHFLDGWLVPDDAASQPR